MTYTPFQAAIDELAVEDEMRRDEELSLHTPSEVDKAGPDFVPGASEAAEEALKIPRAASLISDDPNFLQWVESQGLTEEDLINMAEERKNANLLNTGITGYETPFSGLEGVKEATMPVTQGLVDTGLGAASLITGGITDPIKDFWHDKNPQSDNAVSHTVRKLSGVVLPSIMAPQVVLPALANSPWAMGLPAAVKTTGAIAARLGLDTGIVASSTSADDENAAKALNDTFGWSLPWATREGAGPDERRWYNLMENLGMAGAVELVQGAFSLRTILKNRHADRFIDKQSWLHNFDLNRSELHSGQVAPGSMVEWDPGLVAIPQTEEAVEGLIRNADQITQETVSPAIKEIDDQIEQLGLLDELGEAEELRLAELVAERAKVEVDEMAFDPLTKNLDEAAKARENGLLTEATERVQTNQGEYDPIIHDPAEAQARAQSGNGPADTLGAMVDHHRILNDMNTTNGRARAALPTSGLRKLVSGMSGSERGDFLEELVAAMSPSESVEWLIEGKWKATPEDLKAAVDHKVLEIYNLDTESLAEAMNVLKSKVTLGQEFLGDEEFITYSLAFREVFNNLYDPQKIRASALATQQAADNVTDASRAAQVLDGVLDSRRQQELLIDNLAVVAKETRANRYLWGYQGQLLDMVKDPSPNVTQKLVDLLEKFEDDYAKIHTQTDELTNTLKQINSENPELLKPFVKAFDITDGNVDDIIKLNRWAEKNVSWTKLFVDMDPSTPSLFAQGLHGIRYNSLLNGLAPIRAFAGNSAMTIGKPISMLAGSAFEGVGELARTGSVTSSAATIKRALYTYGGVVENFQRAMQHMAKEWDYAVKNPEKTLIRGRADVKFAQTDNFEALESMADIWEAEGRYGNLFFLKMAQAASWYNNLPINRWGINALHAIDGFTNSMMASGMARAKAYDELLGKTNGVINPIDFDDLQRHLYSQSFDETGLLTDTAAKHAASEISLNLDQPIVKKIDDLIKHVPALKPLFMFPRTGINGLAMAWSYNPMSGLGMAMGKARKVFNAKHPLEIEEALKLHGINEVSEEAFMALKNEYRGRQVMGGAVVMGAGLMAFNGNLTGNGPHDYHEKQDMLRMGWKPNSIRLGGKWYSYRGLEPYQQILSLTADTIYYSTRVDEAATEDILNKLRYAITMNVTNQTFLSGLRPLVGLINGDPTTTQRFIAGWTDPLVPFYWSGARNVLNNVVTPQLKDVDNDFREYIKNNSRFFFRGNEELKDQLDVYTGEPINYHDPWTSTVNAFLPYFKSNGGMEPWREWLLASGWNNLNKYRMNKYTKAPLTASDRFFINNYVAQYGGLKEQIERIMEMDRKGKFTQKYVDARGQMSQKEYPISSSFIHQELDRVHDIAFKNAWLALEQDNRYYRPTGLLEKYKKKQIESGNLEAASQTQNQIQELLKLSK
jgi:hypothetical protein